MLRTHARDAAVVVGKRDNRRSGRRIPRAAVQNKRPGPGSKNRLDLNEAVRVLDSAAEAYFWSRVEHGEPEVCWPWTAGKLPKGYGLTGIAGRSALAHRVAYIIAHGPIPEGLVVRHTCHNPQCCNPSHLIAGTYAQNEADKKTRQR
jgi:hypothetical protein